VGTHTVTANYFGDAQFLGSAGDDSASPHVVQQAHSAVTLRSLANPAIFSQSVTFTVTVSAAAPGVGKPTGTVNFFEGTTVLASNVSLVLGNATFRRRQPCTDRLLQR
jgi:hypothetical protein